MASASAFIVPPLGLGSWAAAPAQPQTSFSIRTATNPAEGARSARYSPSRPSAVYGLGASLFGFVVALGSRSESRGHRKRVNRPPRSKITAFAARVGESLTLFSPAKINLFLRIIGRRPDGYHDLASLFHTVSLGDELRLEVLPENATKDTLKCNLPGVPEDDSNLVIRALNLFRYKSGEKNYFHVDLLKSTPAQAGMGGGSSNAATAFFAANSLCGKPASQEELIGWADDPIIGSDATFFLSQGTAYCTGRGEVVTPVGQLPNAAEKTPVFLVKPNFGLSTPKVFKALDLSTLSSVPPETLLETFQGNGLEHSSWVNDLEKPAFVVEPTLGELKDFLVNHEGFDFKAVLMSGSGTTIYCIGDPACGAAAFRQSTTKRFDIEGIWVSKLVRRASDDSWYEVPGNEDV